MSRRVESLPMKKVTSLKMSPLKILVGVLFIVSVNLVTINATDIDPDTVDLELIIADLATVTTSTSTSHGERTHVTTDAEIESTDAKANGDGNDDSQMMSDVPSLTNDTINNEPPSSGLEKEDVDDQESSATGAIDINLINSNFVGRYNGNPCSELGTSVINLLNCCSFTAGPLDSTNVRKCCLAQGSNCNYNPNACCNYLQTACLPDPILSGIYTCQKVDTFKPRVAPVGYNVNPLGYLPNSNPIGGQLNNYQQQVPNYDAIGGQNYGAQFVGPVDGSVSSYLADQPPLIINQPLIVDQQQQRQFGNQGQPVAVPTTTVTEVNPNQRTIDDNCLNVDNSPGLIDSQCPGNRRRSLHAIHGFQGAPVVHNPLYQSVLNNILTRSIQSSDPGYKVDPLNLPYIGGSNHGKR